MVKQVSGRSSPVIRVADELSGPERRLLAFCGLGGPHGDGRPRQDPGVADLHAGELPTVDELEGALLAGAELAGGLGFGHQGGTWMSSMRRWNSPVGSTSSA
jgi:hypothetical protein